MRIVRGLLERLRPWLGAGLEECDVLRRLTSEGRAVTSSYVCGVETGAWPNGGG